MTFIGVDIGTSFIKGAVLDLRNRTFHHVRRSPFPDPLPGLNPLFCEYEPQQILRAIEMCIRDLADLAEDCQGIVICNQMHSTVLVGPGGKIRSNCIGWRDQRAQMQHPSLEGTYYELYQERLSLEQKRVLGNERPVGSPACLLFWAAEQKLIEPGTTPVALGSFVLSQLCETPPTTEATNAMAYELLDLEAMTWHEGVIADLGLQAVNLPPLVEQNAVVGHLAHRGTHLPCYAPVGDYQCALAGAMISEHDLSLNISTGSQVSRIRNAITFGEYQTRPFFDGKFTSTVTHLPAGRALNLLVDLLTELPRAAGTPLQDPWRWIVQAADITEQTDLETRTSFFPGPRGSRGAISNIGEKNLTVGALFRSAFEDMAANYYACALQIWPEQSWDRIVLSGGLSQKIPLLRHVIEARFQGVTSLCHIREDTLSGLLMMALTFSGSVASMELARNAVQTAFANTREIQRLDDDPEH